MDIGEDPTKKRKKHNPVVKTPLSRLLEAEHQMLELRFDREQAEMRHARKFVELTDSAVVVKTVLGSHFGW